MVSYLQGAGIGFGLIVAIGAQNAFVLSQGLRRNYSFIIPLICSICDAILITIGVAGMGTLVASNELFTLVMTLGGSSFLFWYGWRSLKSAFNEESLILDNQNDMPLKTAFFTVLAVSLLNPHAILDTVVLLGGISGQFNGFERFLFASGAITASFLWFFSLSYGSRILAPIFSRPVAWRVLDILICITMWSIALSLLLKLKSNFA